MKWMIASDLHGSAYWCEKMIERYREEKAGKLILLGDILYHGPRNDLPRDYAPKKVIEMLNGMKEELLCIRGNCDCDVDQMVLQFPIMAEYAALWLDERMVWRPTDTFSIWIITRRLKPAIFCCTVTPTSRQHSRLARDFTTSTRARCPSPKMEAKTAI